MRALLGLGRLARSSIAFAMVALSSAALAQDTTTSGSVVAPEGGDPQHGLPQSDDSMAGRTAAPPIRPPGTMPGHPAAAQAHAGRMRDPFDAPPVATSEPSTEVPAGSVRVLVVDVEGRPIEGATVILGTMQQGGDRDRISASTDASGTHTWSGLATGTSQAYRVSVPYEGASYGAAPFQLPTDRGYQVRVVRLPITHDDRTVLQVIGQTFVEIREERLHVIQQAQLANMSQTPQTYVFPDGGLRVRLPEGFLAFQSQPVMTDQRVEEIAGQGIRIRGSLPPGRVTLTWAFDLPIAGSEMDVTLNVPFRTYIYRVITDAPPGLDLDIDGGSLPEPQEFEDEGRRLFGAEVQRRPGDPPFDHFTLRFRGIPGPGPIRWIALGAALLFLFGGAILVIRGGSVEEIARQSREDRKRELLEEAAALEERLGRGEVGPQFRQTRREAIVRELAVLLHQEKSAGSSRSSKNARSARVPAQTEGV